MGSSDRSPGAAGPEPSSEPPRTDAIPGSYALDVGEEAIHVWEFRINAAAQDGEWYFVETLDRADDPYVSLEYAKLRSPSENGYWVYSRSYECKLECA